VPDWLGHEALFITAPDGARLSARWFPRSDAVGTVVLAHPDRRYGQDWFVVTGWIDLLGDARLNVLTFDFVGYGQSQGGSSYFHEHLIAAVDEARRRAPALPLHLVGLSLGAFVAINAAVEIPDLRSLVLESPYPTFAAWYAGRWQERPLRWLQRWFPATGRRIDAARNMERLRTPTILVAASRSDEATAASLTRRVAAAGPSHVEYLELDGIGHLELFHESPQYRRRVLEALRPIRSQPRVPEAHAKESFGGAAAGRPRRNGAGVQSRVASGPRHGEDGLRLGPRPMDRRGARGPGRHVG
jgi:pimeloyl-ACP methyl ester carboxylesterase